VNDFKSLRFILNQTEVLGQKVNFHENSRTKIGLSSILYDPILLDILLEISNILLEVCSV
jgi:hypothetical protein